MSVALRGNLRDFGIAEVFQLIGQQRKTGVLDVTHGKQTVRLAFDAGCVVWGRPVGGSEDTEVGERLVRCGLITNERLSALQNESENSARPVPALAVDAGDITAEDGAQIEQLITNETIFVVLRWSEGSFDFTAQAVHHHQPPENLLAAEQILMDGLRMVDEWQTFAPLVPDLSTVFERNSPIVAYKRTLAADAKARVPAIEKVFSLVDGRLTVQRIIDLSRLGLFDATRALAELHQQEVILPLTKRQAQAQKSKEPGGPGVLRATVDHARLWLAAAIPLALLAAMVVAILNQPPAIVGPPVFPILRAPLVAAQDAFHKRRVLQAVEAEHLLSGEWPTGAGTLTGARGDAYYYARRGDGIVLLAPER